jgi:hypothetical protein
LDLQINQDTIPLRIVDFVNGNPAFDQNEDSEEKIVQEIESPKYTILITYVTASGKKEGTKMKVEHYRIKVLVRIKEL